MGAQNGSPPGGCSGHWIPRCLAQRDSITISLQIQPSASLSQPFLPSRQVLWLSGDFQIQKSPVPSSANFSSTSQLIRRPLLPHGGGGCVEKRERKDEEGLRVSLPPGVIASLGCRRLPSTWLVSRIGPLAGCAVGWQRSGWVPTLFRALCTPPPLGPLPPLPVLTVLCPGLEMPGSPFRRHPAPLREECPVFLCMAGPLPCALKS